ncbi:deSI-like protein At4g17486 [Amaranthus tricolor]|uniref:deSI-like protein At4g17486 n=1 Tax=Amaranthus tricolor TaxID=29722 RepID=UPI002590464B|nr:deSI-like protein At4g17486 [Amaranthus tricolor]
MLCRMVPKKKKTGIVPVYLNVYDLTPINGYAYWLGLGVYHSGVQVHDIEYAFGAHEHSASGVFEVEPKQCPGFTYRKSILIGRTDLDAKEVHTLIEKLSKEYFGNTYNLISKNCNHFCNDLCIRLTGKPIPSWVNRLARLGLLCKCVLPAALNESKVRHIRAENKNRGDVDKKKLRSQSSRFDPSNSNSSTLSDCSTSSASRSRRQRRCVPPSSSVICAYPPPEAVS